MSVASRAEAEILESIRGTVKGFDPAACRALCREALERGFRPKDIMGKALIPTMEEAGRLYEQGVYFVPQLLLCCDAMEAGLEILRPVLRASEAMPEGRLLIGVVAGDIHEIGKNLVATLFQASGWDVLDLGPNVAAERFIEAQRQYRAEIIGLSALMTTTMQGMPEIIAALRGCFPQVRILVGGACLTADIAGRYGADGYAPNAAAAVREACRHGTSASHPFPSPGS